MNDTTKLLLEHCLSYIEKYHANDDGGVHINLIARLNEKIEKPAHKPVAWISPNVYPFKPGKDNHPCILTPFECAANTIPLYAEPPTRNPLSDDEIEKIWLEMMDKYRREHNDQSGRWPIRAFARSLEKSHAID